MERKLTFMAVILTILFTLIPSTSSLVLDLPIARGRLGSGLYYRMYSLAILKIGTNTTISFQFSAGTEIFIETIYVGIWGSAFRPIPDFSISRLVMSNETLHTSQSINYSIPINPLEEGNIVFEVKADYNFTGGSDSGRHEVILQAKSMTYDELFQGYSSFRNFSIVFLTTTIVLILIIVYVNARKKTID